MKNGIVVLAVALSVASFGGMMRIKTDVQQLVRERGQLAERQIELKETKRVLEAEYAMLASPVRLAALARQRGFQDMTMGKLVPVSAVGPGPAAAPEPAPTLAEVLQRAQAMTSASGTVATPVVTPTAAVPGRPADNSLAKAVIRRQDAPGVGIWPPMGRRPGPGPRLKTKPVAGRTRPTITPTTMELGDESVWKT